MVTGDGGMNIHSIKQNASLPEILIIIWFQTKTVSRHVVRSSRSILDIDSSYVQVLRDKRLFGIIHGAQVFKFFSLYYPFIILLMVVEVISKCCCFLSPA